MRTYKLVSRYIIDLSLKPEAPIHIGSGEELIIKSIVMMKIDERYIPIIPAESIKGVIRAIATRIAKNMKFNTKAYGIFDVDEIVKSHRKDGHPEFVKKFENITNDDLKKLLLKLNLFDEEYINRLINELGVSEIMELATSLSCPICLLFGAKHFAGKSLLSDAIPMNQNGEITRPKIETKTEIAIQRNTQTVKKGRLYIIQYIVPSKNIHFKAKMIIDNVVNGTPEAKLLLKLLKYINAKGLFIGGMKSKGYGKMKVDIKITKLNFKKPKNKNDTETILGNIKALLLKENI